MRFYAKFGPRRNMSGGPVLTAKLIPRVECGGQNVSALPTLVAQSGPPWIKLVPQTNAPKSSYIIVSCLQRLLNKTNPQTSFVPQKLSIVGLQIFRRAFSEK